MYYIRGDDLKGKTVVFITDNVQKELCELIKIKGNDAVGVDRLPEEYSKEFLKAFDNIILPFPSRNEKMSFLPKGKALSEFLSPHQLIIGGMLSDEIKNEAEKAGVKYEDYFENDAYVLKNAFITSQGALKLLLDTANAYIAGKKVLITGFGRIGKSLAGMLKGLGMKVFVAARGESARAEAADCGYEVFTFSQLSATLFYYDYIFNTVPERIFTERDIRHIRNDTFYFELASKPFGADEADFISNKKSFINGSALPGRYFPRAVAENIYNYLFLTGR